MNVNGGTGNAAGLEEIVDILLTATLTFLAGARDDWSAGDMASGNREELSAHRAYQESLYLFRVLHSHICPAGAQSLPIRIEEIGNAMRGG